MALLEMDARLLSVLGDDVYAQNIMASCAELGIDVSHSVQIPGRATSTYLFLADHRGDMVLAVSDMDIYQSMTPGFLSRRQKLLDGAQVVVSDTNPPEETLVYLAKHCTAPLFCDPVSSSKAEKLRPILDKIHTLKPNRLEAELLSGIAITDETSLQLAAKTLLHRGLKRVFISLGKDGVLAADEKQMIHLANLSGTLVNTTGCGDAFMAALTWAYLHDKTLEETARLGLSAASIAMESPETINPAMCEEELLHRCYLNT
jgi:pseudouridine kinase